jgi:hypothetical protein
MKDGLGEDAATALSQDCGTARNHYFPAVTNRFSPERVSANG